MVRNAVRYVGKIDLKIYRCVTADIRTDEVVITEKQVQHVLQGHPQDAHRYTLRDLAKVVAEPDYILRDVHEEHACDTAIVMKRFAAEDGGCRVILRLATSREPEGIKNSIITAFYVSEKKWGKYLRNKIILYKRG